jgi:hypothetical protein
MGHGAAFGVALWAIAQNHSSELDNSFEKLAISFKGTVTLESACI